MSLLAFAVELYFALMLGVSGLAKANDPQYFAAVLRQQQILPERSIKTASKILPWIEVFVALLLVSGVGIIITSIMVLALFTLFLGVKLFLFLRGRVKDCGCYGSAKPQQIDAASITVSTIFVLVAIVHVWLVIHTTSINSLWRLIPVALLVGGGVFLFRKIITRQGLPPSTSNLLSLSTGGLNKGMQAPAFSALDQHGAMVRLSDSQGKRRILLFISPGCSVCPKALEALHSFLSDGLDIVALVIGGTDYERNQVYVIEQKIQVPLLTPDSDWVEKLYHVQSFPIAFLLNERDVILAGGVVNSVEHLYGLLEVAKIEVNVS